MKKFSLIVLIVIRVIILNAQTVHLVSALGADSIIYSNIQLDPSFKTNHVKWIKPLKGESLRAYSIRLVRINNITENDIVIGTSFGGIVATEIVTT